MKRFVFIILILLPVVAFAQAPIQVSSPYQYNKYVKVLDSLVSKNVIIPRVAAFPTPKQTGQIVNKQDTVCFWNGSAWISIRKVTWPEDSVRYASKSGVAADTAKLHNQIITKLAITDTIPIHNQIATKQPQLSGTGFVKASGTTITYDNSTYQPVGSYVLTSDTARYISKSQARKDIHDSIAPLRVDIRTLQSENFLGYYPIPPNDTLKISVGNIFSDDGIFISRFVLKDSLGHKHLGENLNILSDINAIYIDYGKNITNASINFAQSFEIGIDLETIYWVIINRNSYRLFLKYFKNSITNQL